MNRSSAVELLLAMGVGVSACGNDSTAPGVSYIVTDPAGDVFGVGTVKPDITKLTIRTDTGGIDIFIDFAANVLSPVTGNANAVVGYVELDTDQDSTTGAGTVVDVFRPTAGSTGMGVEYAVDLFDYNADSTVAVFETAGGTTTGTVRPRFAGKRVTLRVPRALIGGDDGKLHAASIFGTAAEPTDIVPNNGHLAAGGASAFATRGRSGAMPAPTRGAPWGARRLP